jgi:hypothetical protein
MSCLWHVNGNVYIKKTSAVGGADEIVELDPKFL